MIGLTCVTNMTSLWLNYFFDINISIQKLSVLPRYVNAHQHMVSILAEICGHISLKCLDKFINYEFRFKSSFVLNMTYFLVLPVVEHLL